MKILISRIRGEFKDITLWLTLIFITLGAYKFFFDSYADQDLNDQNLFYLYSSASQTVATFMAFVFAGYVFVHQAYDGHRHRDLQYEAIVETAMKNTYCRLIFLAILTTITVLVCLFMLWQNGLKTPWLKFPTWLANTLTFYTIAYGLWFVIKIVNPDNFKYIATEIIVEKYGQSNNTIARTKFIDTFIDIELVIGQLWNEIARNRSSDNYHWNRKFHVPLSKKINDLEVVEKLPKEITESLKHINEYRNLAVHGKIDHVDQKIYDKAVYILNYLKSKTTDTTDDFEE